MLERSRMTKVCRPLAMRRTTVPFARLRVIVAPGPTFP